MHSTVKKLLVSALCLSLCMVLPLLTGQIKQIGNALCPMHIPVLLCGFLCGPWWALSVGIVAPLLRFLLFGMPKLYPSAIAMCFELAAYGAASGLLYRALPKKALYIYISLIASMLIGRAVWGAAQVCLFYLTGDAYTWELFISGAFLVAIPGIILQLILIPAILLALRSAGLFDVRRPPASQSHVAD